MLLRVVAERRLARSLAQRHERAAAEMAAVGWEATMSRAVVGSAAVAMEGSAAAEKAG